jgi:alkylation response protein AidB-like acyl-CoA dehydrogenase
VTTAASLGLLDFPLLETLLLGPSLQASLADLSRGIVSGAQCATIAWSHAASAETKADHSLLTGVVGRAPGAGDVDWLLVRVGDDAAALVPATAAGVVLEGTTGLDLATPEYTVRLDSVSVAKRHLLPAGTWSALQSEAMILRAAAIMGSAETCLAMAQEHASTRRQFGHALAYNQAIRHALARHKLGLESIRQAIARGLLGKAGALERSAAFLAAASHGVAISQGALQIHGGMGFTWDAPVHRHLRRILALQAQGDASGLLRALAHSYISEIAPASEAAA